MDDSGRVIIYLLWAFGCVLFWGIVVQRDIQALRAYPDSRRSRRELVADASLLVTAAAAALSLIILLVLGPDNQRDGRAFILAVALGAFLASGIIKATYGQRA